MDTYIIGIIAVVAAVIFMAAKKSKDKKKTNPRSGWVIGPTINGKNYSQGMPERPTPQGNGWYFDFPTVPHIHVHALQWFDAPSLRNVKAIEIRFSITGGDFVPQEFNNKPALLTLCFQRSGDDWSAQGKMETYRWYSRKTVPLKAGEFVMTVPMDISEWGAVMSSRDPAAFADAIFEMDNVSLGFGAAGGRAHGVYARQPSRFTLHEIKFLT